MKQAFLLLILITLFSFLSSDGIACPINFKMACKKFDFYSCQCVPKDVQGEYAYVKECQTPLRPACIGNRTTLNCFCS